MKRRSATLLAFVLGAAGAAAQENPPANVDLFGRRYDGFRGLFAQRNLALGTAAEFDGMSGDEAANWIVVALGDVSNVRPPPRGWRWFVENGGTLLVATDHGNAPMSDDFGVTFHARPVIAGEGVECYPPNQRDCPLVTDFAPDSILFENIDVLAVNVSGYLSVLPHRGKSTYANLPLGTMDTSGAQVGGRPVVYGAAVPEGRGRFLFAADHSIFINELMENENGAALNAVFADNVVDWLIAARNPAGLRVLFLEDGRPIDQWIDPRYVTGDWPTSTLQEKMQALDKLLRAIDQMVLDQERRRDPETGLTLYNQSARNWEQKQRPGAFLNAALWGLAAFLMMVSLGWLLARRAPPVERAPAGQLEKPPAPPPYGPKSEDEPTHRSLLDRRRVEMLEEGHYEDLARRLSRVWLTQQLGETPAGPPAEPFVLRHAPQRLRVRWRQAWTLATDAEHPAMSLPQFQRFRADLAIIQQTLDRSRPVSSRSRVSKENA